MKILIDANVALDVLLEREPFYISGAKVLSLSKGGIELFFPLLLLPIFIT